MGLPMALRLIRKFCRKLWIVWGHWAFCVPATFRLRVRLSFAPVMSGSRHQ